jgi:hypothetical protein
MTLPVHISLPGNGNRLLPTVAVTPHRSTIPLELAPNSTVDDAIASTNPQLQTVCYGVVPRPVPAADSPDLLAGAKLHPKTIVDNNPEDPIFWSTCYDRVVVKDWLPLKSSESSAVGAAFSGKRLQSYDPDSFPYFYAIPQEIGGGHCTEGWNPKSKAVAVNDTQACVQACDADASCVYISYRPADGTCSRYTTCVGGGGDAVVPTALSNTRLGYTTYKVVRDTVRYDASSDPIGVKDWSVLSFFADNGASGVPYAFNDGEHCLACESVHDNHLAGYDMTLMLTPKWWLQREGQCTDCNRELFHIGDGVSATLAPVSAGSVELIIKSSDGFAIGDHITIGTPGTAVLETGVIATVNPFHLLEPLKHNHVINTLIIQVSGPTTTAAAATTTAATATIAATTSADVASVATPTPDHVGVTTAQVPPTTADSTPSAAGTGTPDSNTAGDEVAAAVAGASSGAGKRKAGSVAGGAIGALFVLGVVVVAVNVHSGKWMHPFGLRVERKGHADCVELVVENPTYVDLCSLDDTFVI